MVQARKAQSLNLFALHRASKNIERVVAFLKTRSLMCHQR